MKDIILTTINAKWIHPSLALRLLKANLGALEDRCEIIEFALRQPLAEKINGILAALQNTNIKSTNIIQEINTQRILGISISIWNHTATLELLVELEKHWVSSKPIIVLGGPEVSHLPPDAEIFRYADYVIRGEGEIAFRTLCEDILIKNIKPQSITEENPEVKFSTSVFSVSSVVKFINATNVNLSEIKSAYHLYTDEDITRKLIYVEASRGCPFNCEFCLSAVKDGMSTVHAPQVREFPIEPFLAQMDTLVKRGVKTFKFLDRTFNVNIPRAKKVMDFFLERIEERSLSERLQLEQEGLTVHFEMVASLFPQELRETLVRFPQGSLRLEVGIQTLNEEVARRINRPVNPEKELEALRFLNKETNAIIHVDLIAGLPGEDIASFGRGFDALWQALSQGKTLSAIEIQLGILKLLPGAPIARYSEEFKMRYNPLPPYEVEETSVMSAVELERIKNFARFWEIIINRGIGSLTWQIDGSSVFDRFLDLSDALYAHFGRNWGINKDDLLEFLRKTGEFTENQ